MIGSNTKTTHLYIWLPLPFPFPPAFPLDGETGGTESGLILCPLLVAEGLRGDDGDGGANQAYDKSLAERHRIAFDSPADADDEQGVDGRDDCGDVLLHFGIRFRSAFHLTS